MIKLTVAIPTYNRNIKAANQVRQLLEQIRTAENPSVELLVVDNASDVPVEQTLRDIGLADDPQLRIVRNPANVGLAANLNRSVEHARGEWVWLLGDDDRLIEKALDVVLSSLEHVTDGEFAMQFSYRHVDERKSDAWSDYPDVTVDSLQELCKLASDGQFCSHLMFISTAVYRRSAYLDILPDAYHWNGTVAPHLAVIFISMRNGGKLRLHSKRIIEKQTNTGSDRCNTYRVGMGLQTLIEIEGCEQEMHEMMDSLTRHWNGAWKALIYLPIRCLRSNRPTEFWRAWYFRGAASTSGILALVMVFSALVVAPIGCSKTIRSIIFRWKGLRNDTIGLERN